MTPLSDVISVDVHSAGSAVKAALPVPDVYFSPGYGMAEEANGEGPWTLLTACDGQWQLPVHLRDSELGRDAVSPYGYAGVYASSELSQEQRDAAWVQSKRVLRDMGVISIFLRQTPLLASPFEEIPGQHIVSGHATVAVDTSDAEAAWRRMEGRSRTSIRKADREGYCSSIRPVEERDFERTAPFRRLYEGSMRRREASDRYFFTDAYYTALREALGTNLLVAMSTDPDGEVIAAALFMRHGHLLHYHLSGSTPEAGRAGATNQLVWSAIAWASDHEVARLHLGGGVRDGDTLFRFKRSFGGDVLRFDAYGVVLDEPAYRAAEAARARQFGAPQEELATSQYFPSFRTPA